MNVQPSRRTYAVTLFLILVVCYGYFFPKWADWGANSRADLVYAVGDKGVLYIDDYEANTGDEACYPGPYTQDVDNIATGKCEGHFYTDKSIGPSLLALPFYMVFKGIAAIPPIQNFIQSGKGLGSMGDTLNPDGQGIRPEAVYQYMALIFITLFATSIPSAFLGVVVFLMACRFTKNEFYAFLVGILYGLGTIAFPYSNVLYQHQLAAFGLFISFYLLWRVIYENASLRWLWLVGFLFSVSIVTEYPVFIALAILFLWAVIVMKNRLELYRLILAAIPLGIVFAAYNMATFQSPLPVGYEYSTNWQNVHDIGFLSLTIPNPETLLGLTFSPFRGIFFLSPALLLAIPGFIGLWTRFKQYRSGVITMLIVIAFFFMYNSSSAMWWGGHTVGPRYLAPMTPFLALPVVVAIDQLARNKLAVWLIGLLFVLSFLNVWIQTISGQAFPPAFTDANEPINNPLFQYSLPLFVKGELARNYGMIVGLRGFLSLIPLGIVVTGLYMLIPRWLTRREQQVQLKTPQTAGGTD